jgi:hypothetical protein
MNAPWPRRGQAYTQAPRIFCVSARSERCGFFVPHLDESDLAFVGPERFENSIDAVSGKTKYHVHPPVNETLDHQISYCFAHRSTLVAPASPAILAFSARSPCPV